MAFGFLFKGGFFIPASSAFFGAFAAFMMNYVMTIIRDRHAEKTTLYKYKFIVDVVNKSIKENEKVYMDTGKGVVFSGYSTPKFIEGDIMFLLKRGDKGRSLLNKILCAKAAYEQVCNAIKVRNKLLLNIEHLKKHEKLVLAGFTELLDEQFEKLPSEMKSCVNSIEKHITCYYA